MSKHVCVICYLELPRSQRTCGSADCIDAWKNIRSTQARTKRVNMATYTPSERALIDAQTPDDMRPTDEIVELLTTPKPESAGERFSRSFLFPDAATAPIKKEEPNDPCDPNIDRTNR